MPPMPGMNREESADLIQIDDLNDNLRQVADLIGMDSTMKLIEVFGGTDLYFPQLETISRKYRDQFIYEKFTGGNYRELSSKFKLSVRQIQTIVQQQRLERRQ